jgi:long-chain acyl-CoA synthetase
MPQTLAGYAQLHLSLGNETAFVYRRGFRTHRWTYAQVGKLSNCIAHELERRNINKGDRVMLWGDNSAEWVAAFFAIMLRGAVAVPMDKIAAPGFAQRVASDVDAKLYIGSAALAEHANGVPWIELEALHDKMNDDCGPYTPVAVTRDDPAQIIFTSGTTADPRGVVLTHGNILTSVDPIEREIPKYRKYERIFHPIRFLHMLPLSHVFGQTMGMFIPPVIAGTVLFQDSFKPSDVIETIRRERVSVLVAVPRIAESMKARLEADLSADIQKNWAIAEKEKFLKRWWRFRKVHSHLGWKFWAIISGGAALDQSTEEFWRRLGYGVIQGYGLTETSSLVSLNHPFKIAGRSIGKVLGGREMKLDPDTGEILVRGANVAKQYWQGKELKPVTGEEGWFRTGDLGAVDADGNLYFKGRSKNVIVTPAGLKIYPEDLEQALRQQPEIRDCVVFGVARGGNSEACAALLMRNGGSANTAVSNANKQLADFQKIRCWLEWPDEDFPRTPTQKPKMDMIRRAAEAKLGVAVGEASAQTISSSGTLQDIIASIAGRSIQLKPGSQLKDAQLQNAHLQNAQLQNAHLKDALPKDAHLEDDLNLSSLERVELMAALENRYQVELSDRDFSQVTTVSELENLLKKSSPRQVEPFAHNGSSTQPDSQTKNEETTEKENAYPYSRWAQRWPIAWIRTLVYHLITLPYILIMGRPRVIGRQNLKDFHETALIVSNHITHIDIGYILAALPFRMRQRVAVAMQGEMLRSMRYPAPDVPLFRRLLDQLDYFLIAAFFNVFSLPQRARYRESFKFAGEMADKGYNVVIFPEGRRTDTGEMSAFRSGIGLLATHLDLPVIPMRIDGLYPLKVAKKHYASPGAIQVHIGDPIRFETTADPEDIARELQRIVAGL